MVWFGLVGFGLVGLGWVYRLEGQNKMHQLSEIFSFIVVFALLVFIAGVSLFGYFRKKASVSPLPPEPTPEPLIFGTHHFVANEDSGDGEPWTVYPYATSTSAGGAGFSVASRECAVTLMATLDAYVGGRE